MSLKNQRKRKGRKGLTQKQAAEILSLSHQRISQLVKAGKMKLLDDGSIDPHALKKPQKSTMVASQEPTSEAPAPELGPETEPGEEHNRWYWEDRLAEAKAKNAWLDYEQKAGELVQREIVEEYIFEVCRTVRDRLLAVPDRIAPLLAKSTSIRTCRDIAMREQRQALEELVMDMEQIVEKSRAS